MLDILLNLKNKSDVRFRLLIDVNPVPPTYCGYFQRFYCTIYILLSQWLYFNLVGPESQHHLPSTHIDPTKALVRISFCSARRKCDTGWEFFMGGRNDKIVSSIYSREVTHKVKSDL